jgi:hypothetical protein
MTRNDELVAVVMSQEAVAVSAKESLAPSLNAVPRSTSPAAARQADSIPLPAAHSYPARFRKQQKR